MTALFLLLILVAGFLYCHIHPVQKIRLHRYTGQYLYLRAAGYGVRALGVTAMLALLPNTLTLILWLSSCLKNTGLAGDTLPQTAWLIALSIGMFGIIILHALFAFFFHVLRFRTLNLFPHLMGKLLRDSPLDAQLYRLYLQRRPVMLSMADRKIYVGMIADMGEPTETEGPDQEIALLPMLSGYREKDTLKVEFTTFYNDFYGQETETERKVPALTIILRQSNIVSATEFSDSAYAHWNTSSPARNAPPLAPAEMELA